GRGLDGLHHPRVGVAQDQRSPRPHVVDVPVSIQIPQMRARAPLKKPRHAPHGAKGPDRAVDPAGDSAARPFEGGPGRGNVDRHAPSSSSHRAASSAWYVRMKRAPARLTASRYSSTTARSSIHPAAAAALIMAYSPLTA